MKLTLVRFVEQVYTDLRLEIQHEWANMPRAGFFVP